MDGFSCRAVFHSVTVRSCMPPDMYRSPSKAWAFASLGSAAIACFKTSNDSGRLGNT